MVESRPSNDLSSAAGLGWTRRATTVLPPLLAVVVVHSRWLFAATERVAGDLNLWGWLEGTQHWYWHIAHDLFHGTNPFVNNFKAFPDGNNHLSLHGNFGDALLAAPLEWLFDFPLSYNLAVLLFTALNAYGLFRLLRRMEASPMAASVGSILVIVHPYFLTQLEQGRLTQYLVGWAFLALAEALPVILGQSRRIAWLTVCWAATFVSFWFYGAFLSLFLLGWAAVALWRRPWAELRPLLKSFGMTVAICIPFGLPLLFEATVGAGIPGVSFFELPEPSRWLNTAAGPLDFLVYVPSEFGPVVLPATLLLLAGMAVLAAGRSRNILGLAVCALGAGLLALGPFLLSGGEGARQSTGLPLPWYLLYVAVPFFSRLSYPVMVFPFLLAAVLMLVARSTAALRRLGGDGRWAAWLPTGALLLVLLELTLRVPPSVAADPYHVPEPYRWLAMQEEADALLEYPFGYTDCARIYQTTHRMCLMGTEGRFEDLRQWPPVDALFSRQPALEKLAAVQSGSAPMPIAPQEWSSLYAEGFDYLAFRPIACGRQPELSASRVAATRAWLTAMLGPPVREADGVTVYRLPGSGPQRAACGQ